MAEYWRPEDWENPHKFIGGEELTTCEAQRYAAIFEAGADAMLKALLFHLSLYCEHDDPPIPKRKCPICWRLLSGVNHARL